jgi:hypothetical protein
LENGWIVVGGLLDSCWRMVGLGFVRRRSGCVQSWCYSGDTIIKPPSNLTLTSPKSHPNLTCPSSIRPAKPIPDAVKTRRKRLYIVEEPPQKPHPAPVRSGAGPLTIDHSLPPIAECRYALHSPLTIHTSAVPFRPFTEKLSCPIVTQHQYCRTNTETVRAYPDPTYRPIDLSTYRPTDLPTSPQTIPDLRQQNLCL